MGVISGMAKGAGREAGRRTGCGFLPEVMSFMGKDLEREISGKTREFYEFVLPPVDMRAKDGGLELTIDMPGFQKDQISLKLDGNIMSVKARREPPGDAKDMLYAQRPGVVEKRIRLPARIKRGEEPECPASLQDGVLVVTVPIPDSGRDIAIG